MATIYKGIESKLARLPGVQAQVAAVAATVLSRAQSAAAGSVDTGAYASSLRLEKHKVDTLVVADDPAAVNIEYGHLAKSNDGGGTWVPGKYILTRAINGAG